MIMRVGESGPHGLGTIGIGIVVGKLIGHEKEAENEKDDGEFDEDNNPEFPSDGHGAETFDVHHQEVCEGLRYFHG